MTPIDADRFGIAFTSILRLAPRALRGGRPIGPFALSGEPKRTSRRSCGLAWSVPLLSAAIYCVIIHELCSPRRMKKASTLRHVGGPMDA